MTESTNKNPEKGASGPVGDISSKATQSGTTSPKKEVQPKPINVDSLLEIAADAAQVDQAVAAKIFKKIDEVSDPAVLIYRLLKNFLNNTNPGVWLSLGEVNVPRDLVTKLCLIVEIDDLSYAWEQFGTDDEESLKMVLTLIEDYTPVDYETTRTFLKERKMLPLALIIFRHFRNSPNELRLIMSNWLEGITKACQRRRFDPCAEAERAAKWLAELSAKKSTHAGFLDATAVVTMSLRGWEDVRVQVKTEEQERAQLDQKLTEESTQLKEALARITDLESKLKESQSLSASDADKIKKLEAQLAFGGAQAGVSEEQALGSLKEQLKHSITAKTEDIRLFLDRDKPNIEASLDLLSQIERNFE